MKKFRIAVIPGDGIGKEVMPEGVRVLVMCGRDEVDPSAPSFDQVYNQINEDKVNSRARRYLRDLRRDAVIEFR